MSTLGRKCQVPVGEVHWAGWPGGGGGQQGQADEERPPGAGLGSELACGGDTA